MVSRLVPQKGLDLIVEVADELLALDLAFVVLGTGRAEYQDLWRELSARHPDRVGAYIGFDEERAHLIEGGADLFLMPSRYEPCGLNQMYSLRYGTVPIVRATGGLADSVEPYNGTTGKGNGFAFRDYSGAALLASLQEALTLFKDRDAWRRLQIAGMSQDNSWNVSAREYVKVYRKACNDAEKRVSGSWEQQGIGPAAADIRPV
jgi:starch synthase